MAGAPGDGLHDDSPMMTHPSPAMIPHPWPGHGQGPRGWPVLAGGVVPASSIRLLCPSPLSAPRCHASSVPHSAPSLYHRVLPFSLCPFLTHRVLPFSPTAPLPLCLTQSAHLLCLCWGAAKLTYCASHGAAILTYSASPTVPSLVCSPTVPSLGYCHAPLLCLSYCTLPNLLTYRALPSVLPFFSAPHCPQCTPPVHTQALVQSYRAHTHVTQVHTHALTPNVEA